MQHKVLKLMMMVIVIIKEQNNNDNNSDNGNDNTNKKKKLFLKYTRLISRFQIAIIQLHHNSPKKW